MPRPVQNDYLRAEVLAVSALDEIVAAIIAANRLRVPRQFLDWVTAEVTPQVELRARLWTQEHAQPHCAMDYRALHHDVHVWVMPRIRNRFGHLAAAAAPIPRSLQRNGRGRLVHSVDVTLP